MDGIRRINESAFEHAVSIALLGVHDMIVIPGAWDHNGRIVKIPYPELYQAHPQLQVTLHSDSFSDATEEDVKIRDWLIEMGKVHRSREDVRDIDLQMTLPRRQQGLEWATGLARLDLHAIPHDIAWRPLYERSLRADWEQTKITQDPSAEALDLFLHRELRRHIFVSCNIDFYKATMLSEYQPGAFVLEPVEAMRYIDLCLKAFGAYRIGPSRSANRELYYWLRLWNLLPAFQSAWPYVVVGRDAIPPGMELMNFLHALYVRIIGQMQAHDRIGWLRYVPATTDTRAEMLNQLNYFIVLATGIFDSLAWLASYRFDVQEERHRVTLRAEYQPGRTSSFFQKLSEHVPRMAAYLRSADRQAKIGLFYGPRDSVQHRFVLTGAHFRTGQYLSDCNIVHLSPDDATAMRAVERFDAAENFPFSDWGLLTFAESEKTILEPYRFTQAALKFVFSLVDEMLDLLDFSSWIGVRSDLKTEADAIIAIGQGRAQDNRGFFSNNLGFAVPYP